MSVFTLLIWFVIDRGKELTPNVSKITTFIQNVKPSEKVAFVPEENFTTQVIHNVESPLGLLLLQIITILLVSKFFGVIIGKIRQPSVIGEMIAGIVLGPSILGFIFPEFSSFLFPKSSLNNLQFLSQIGLAFFMFIIGMELDLSKLKNKAHNALVISHASIIFPYFLGVLVSYFIYEQFAPSNVSFLSFALFMGIAVSITAFPVLARILQERNLTKTSLGTMVLTCAAADDVTAWCILAAVIAIIKAGSIISAVFTIFLAVAFVLFMAYIVRPWIKMISNKYANTEQLSKTLMILVFFIMLFSAFVTEAIGIHALFGAFLAGVIMPQNAKFKSVVANKIEDVSVLLLLPIFFAFTGLRTQIGLLNEGHLWLTCGIIIFIAVLGKFAGSTFAAKSVGISWKDSLSIGALMNTRGLMELIVLNIGYDLGILSPSIFAIMVLMALVTTFMTGPSLDVIEYLFKKKSAKEVLKTGV